MFESCDMRVVVCLPPSFIGNLRNGIEESLNENLMRYREDINAVMISYSKIRLPQTSGRLLEDDPYITFDVNVQAMVFRPTKGMQLAGVVNKVGNSHIGMLVCGVFNASISGKNITNQYSYDDASSTWADLAGEGKELSVGSRAVFQVDRIHNAAGLISIDGSFVGSSEEHSADNEQGSSSSKKRKQTSDSDEEESPPKKKKTKKKGKK
jgi:DNA-directed RNA polymerase I subunit RPA43